MGKSLDRQIERTKFEFWFEDVCAILLFVLHDKEGYGEKRLKRVFNDWNVLWHDIYADYLSKEDIKRVLREECNVDVKRMIEVRE